MKKVFAIIAAALLTLSASAQDVFYPGFYLGAQAGVNYTTSNQWGLKPLEHLNYPNIQLTAGYAITPVFGLRLALSGLYGNYPTPVDNTIVGVFNYAQAALDAAVAEAENKAQAVTDALKNNTPADNGCL